jgi:spermidine synthase
LKFSKVVIFRFLAMPARTAKTRHYYRSAAYTCSAMNTPIDISEESGVRYLHFGSDWVQGAMRIRKPDALELEYTREMMAGLLLRDAVAGPGAADRPGRRLAGQVRPSPPARSALTVVEIAPEVHAVARQFFCRRGRAPPGGDRRRGRFRQQDDSQWD